MGWIYFSIYFRIFFIDLERIKRELSENNVLVEDWGGKIQAIPISAKTGQGIDDLLSSMIIECELLELKANKETLARGTVVDSKLDKGHGPIATVLIQKGTLNDMVTLPSSKSQK